MPEKQVTDIPVSLREVFDRGRAAYNKQNYEYAVALLMQVLAEEPSFITAREFLRATQFKKAGGKRSVFQKAFRGMRPELTRAQMQLKSNPALALNTVEVVLNDDPENLSAHRIFAEAAEACDYPRASALSREIIFERNATDRDNAVKLAIALIDVGRSEKGERIMKALTKAFPDDSEISSAYHRFSAQRTLTESLNKGDIESSREILKDEDETVALEHAAREHRSGDETRNVIEDYKKRIEADPENLSLHRKLADLYLEIDLVDEAIAEYEKVSQLSAREDPTHEKALTEARIRKLELEKKSFDATAADYDDRVADIEKRKLELRLQECESRAGRFPNDHEIQYELGVLYYEMKKTGDAIKRFQRAQESPYRRIKARKYLGLCFARRKMYDLSARSFESAIAEKESFDDEKKELLYEYGKVLEKMERPDEAIEQFKAIYERDVEFRDVEERVDAYYAAMEEDD